MLKPQSLLPRTASASDRVRIADLSTPHITPLAIPVFTILHPLPDGTEISISHRDAPLLHQFRVLIDKLAWIERGDQQFRQPRG